jgi:hypothetical protein
MHLLRDTVHPQLRHDMHSCVNRPNVALSFSDQETGAEFGRWGFAWERCRKATALPGGNLPLCFGDVGSG